MAPTRPLISPSMRREFAERGLFVTDVLFAPDELEVVRAECRRVYEETAEKAARHVRVRPFLPEVHRKSSAVATFLRHPVFQELARELVGADADQAWNQACLKLPDEEGLSTFPFHQDSRFAKLVGDQPGFACFLALGPLSVENGTLHFAAATHHEDLEHSWNAEANWWECAVDRFEIVPGVLPPGAMVVYHRMTPHGSPPNLSGEMREAFLASFAPPGVRLAETGEPFGDQRPLLRNGELAPDAP